MIESRYLVPISRPTIPNLILERLVNLILDEGLRPGDRLPTERDLMTRLSVGRSSLREAIRVLSAIGVVRVNVGEGMFVAHGGTSILTLPLSWGLLMNEDSALEIIETRRVIEVELAGLAAQRASEEDIAALKAAVSELGANQDDGAAFVRIDLELHLAVARAAHNQVMFHILQTLQQVVRAWMDKVTQEFFKGKPQPAFAEHAAVCEAIAAHDAQGARESMGAHLDRGGARLLAVLEEHGVVARSSAKRECSNELFPLGVRQGERRT